MDNKVHLISEQDIHAYIDGELNGDRRQAVEMFLSDRGLRLERAAKYLRNNFDLKSLKDDIYRDPELKAEVDRLLQNRRS